MKTSITETIKLPTLGRLDNIDAEYTMRSMTTFEEKLRLGSKGRFFKTISEIINRCIVDKPEDFDAYNLTLQDFVYLFYQLRVITYGSDYKVSTTCGDCGKKFTETVDLNSLKVNYLPDDFTEPFSITLPRSKDVINLRLLRTREVDDIAKEAEAIKRKNPNYEGDASYMIGLAKKIDSVNGKTMVPSVLDQYVQNMEALDSKYIDYKYDQIDFGLDITVTCTCPHCGEEVTFLLPVGAEFFRPQFDD